MRPAVHSCVPQRLDYPQALKDMSVWATGRPYESQSLSCVARLVSHVFVCVFAPVVCSGAATAGLQLSYLARFFGVSLGWSGLKWLVSGTDCGFCRWVRVSLKGKGALGRLERSQELKGWMLWPCGLGRWGAGM